jgi:hypothetical protein
MVLIDTLLKTALHHMLKAEDHVHDAKISVERTDAEEEVAAAVELAIEETERVLVALREIPGHLVVIP